MIKLIDTGLELVIVVLKTKVGRISVCFCVFCQFFSYAAISYLKLVRSLYLLFQKQCIVLFFFFLGISEIFSPLLAGFGSRLFLFLHFLFQEGNRVLKFLLL